MNKFWWHGDLNVVVFKDVCWLVRPRPVVASGFRAGGVEGTRWRFQGGSRGGHAVALVEAQCLLGEDETATV
ncbi:unnamed protein product [Sphenostylis stenocarpa]|uniref:Uncharacterized protein n=1 Tax=Sphenostylis stenocarpa TaxID=92480 RepID=A0AA86VTW4_9FABA|nr:unnamed protein product [Sphenostylis stenocarpa]